MRVLLCLVALALASCADPTSKPGTPGATTDDGPGKPEVSPVAAELLSIQEARCASCHALGGDADEALRPAPPPSLETLALRVDRGRSTPALAGHFAGEAADDVLAWLATLHRAEPRTFAVIPGGAIERGGQLVRELGCAACHTASELDLSAHTDHAQLVDALQHPGRRHPGVAHVALTSGEASAVAAWLLRGQLQEGARGQGFAWRCFETERGLGQWPDLEGRTPQAKGVSDRITKEVRTRRSNYLLEFTATIEVPRDGEWTFSITSDDGGWLWVDGEQLAANPGMHPAQRSEGRLRLSKGPHELRVGFTQGGGGDVLEVSWQGPGVPEQAIPTEAASTAVLRLVPPASVATAPAAEAVARGRSAARAARCDACHQVSEPAFAELPAPAVAAPWNGLTGTCALGDVPQLAAGTQVPRQVDAATRLHAALVRDGCLSCHVRDGRGGLSQEVKEQLVELEDIGEEGTVPPDLTLVGRRLRPEWLERVVRDGHKARPYVRMRMPAFGADKAARYARWFGEVDAPGVVDDEPPFSEEAAERGRSLAGTGGRNCISCHRMAGRDSLGPQGMDLTLQHQRLRPGWFRDWLLHPTTLRPNTRMPTLWVRGDAQDVADVDAIRTWLSLGDAAPLPPGIVVDRASMQLDPVDRPILHGAFLKDVSARTLMVGTPQRTHFAFDLVEPRLVWLWRGAFVDASGTWVGRAGKLVEPLGSDWQVVDDFTVDGDRRIVGQRRTADGYPVLRVAAGEARYEDEARPRLAAGGSQLVRTLRCTEGTLVVQFPKSESYRCTVAGEPAGRHELAAGQQLEVVYQW
ncbi:MAG: PA14 domain-containing protein [Planctomycetota bacterium]